MMIMLMKKAFFCFTALTCVVAEQELLDHNSFLNASRDTHSGSYRQQLAANRTEPGPTEVLGKTRKPYGTLSSQNQDEVLVLPHTLAIHRTNTTKEVQESNQNQDKFDLTELHFMKGTNATDKSNQRIFIPGNEALSPKLEGRQIYAVVRDVEIALPKPAQVFGEPQKSTYMNTGIELSRPHLRVIESRMTKPEIDNQRIGTQETQDLKILSGQFKSISSVPRKEIVEEIKTEYEHIEPIMYHVKSSHRDTHQTPNEQTVQITERTASLPRRGPVFDLAKFPRLDHPKIQRLQVTKFQNRNISLQLDDISHQMTNGSSFSRTFQPIAIRLKGRGRIPIRYSQRNRNTRPHQIPFKGNTRSRSVVHHFRPSHVHHRENSKGNETSGANSLLRNQDRLNDSTDWIPQEESDQVSTMKPFHLEHPSTQETPLLTTYPNQRVMDNFTISLEHARKLFARAQERYKNLTTENPRVEARNTSSNLESTIDPDQQYSFSYAKIRLNNGSIFLENTVSSSTAPSLATESLAPNSKISISSTTEYQTTPIYTTTMNPPINSSEPSHQQSHDFDKEAKYNSSFFDNERSLPEKYDSTADVKLDDSTEDSSDVLSKVDIGAANYKMSIPDFDNADVVHVTQQDDITKAEPIQVDANNDSIFSKPTLPLPVNKIAPYQSALFPSLQNFNLFGNGNSNHQQQSAYPPVSRLATANTGSQPPNLSNLFGLGSLLGTSSLNTNLGGFSLGQSFSTLNSDSNQQSQQSDTGVGGSGYLSLLSGLSGLDLGHLGRSSSPELSLPSLTQESSNQQSNTGLGLLSGLSSINLGGLGAFGGLGSLGNVGSIPSLSGLGNIMGTSGVSLDGLTGLSGFGLSGDGLNKFSVGSKNVGALGVRSSITPILGKPSIPVGQLSVINPPEALARDALSIDPTIGGIVPELNDGAGSPTILSSVDTKVPDSSLSVKTVKR
ncbi:uncharacterized protein [Palaemon carinicauda]|uniref:uncharacterized protein n=1 Tax=Palaemon carinicauda TaxID=392227 RepID=UPI0035B63F79